LNPTTLRPALSDSHSRAAVRIATLGPVGQCPVAPGTAGSAVGVAVVALLGLLPLSRASHVAVLAGASALLFFVGVWASGHAEKALETVDPGPVVIDEVAGQVVTLLLWPTAGWGWLMGGFLLFRFFDVLKPFPARQSERLPAGWGIMTDDVAAGVYAAVALFLLKLATR